MRAAAQVIDQVVSDKSEVSWDTLHGLLDGAVYLGRIDVASDARVLGHYIRRIFSRDFVPGPGGKPPIAPLA